MLFKNLAKGSKMTVYVAEISGRGIVAFEAANDVEATARLADKVLLRDLRVLQNQGRSLWDGVSKISLRKAFPKELEIWLTRPAAAALSISEDDKNWRIFLIAVVDPSEFDDDRDYDGPGD
jgi:hypothetical protein